MFSEYSEYDAFDRAQFLYSRRALDDSLETRDPNIST